VVKRGDEFLLKPKHSYFSQVQTHVYCTDRHWCDFVIYTAADTDHILVLRVKRDDSFLHVLLDKSCVFFENCVIPEVRLRSVQGKVRDHYVSVVVDNFLDQVEENGSASDSECAQEVPVLFVAPEFLSSRLRDSPGLPPLDSASVEKTHVQVVPVSHKPPVLAIKPRQGRASKNRSVKTVYICGSCDQEAKEEEDITCNQDFAIGCDACMKWYHWGCVAFTGSACNQWYCPDCATVD
jgi:hypothetical protein